MILTNTGSFYDKKYEEREKWIYNYKGNKATNPIRELSDIELVYMRLTIHGVERAFVVTGNYKLNLFHSAIGERNSLRMIGFNYIEDIAFLFDEHNKLLRSEREEDQAQFSKTRLRRSLLTSLRQGEVYIDLREGLYYYRVKGRVKPKRIGEVEIIWSSALKNKEL